MGRPAKTGPPKPRSIPILSTDSLDNLNVPGAHRHVPGGTMKNEKGEVTPWREQTPRTLKRRIIDPGTLTYRVPGHPPEWLCVGRGNPVESCLLTYSKDGSSGQFTNLHR